MKAFWFIFEKLRYLVYAFLFAVTAMIGAGIAAGDIDGRMVQSWLEYRMLQIASVLPGSNPLYHEALRRYEITAQERLQEQNAPATSSLDALKSRQQTDLLRAEKARQQAVMDRLNR